MCDCVNMCKYETNSCLLVFIEHSYKEREREKERERQGIQYKSINFSVKYFDVYIFQLHDLQYEILPKPNHLQELFFINICQTNSDNLSLLN